MPFSASRFWLIRALRRKHALPVVFSMPLFAQDFCGVIQGWRIGYVSRRDENPGARKVEICSLIPAPKTSFPLRGKRQHFRGSEGEMRLWDTGFNVVASLFKIL